MPKRQIVKIEDDGSRWIDYKSGETRENVIEDDPVVSLEQLADLCDNEAEDRNNHGFVNTHKLLAVLMFRMIGRADATRVMREIAEYGGLDGMTGRGGTPSAFSDFGVSDTCVEWDCLNGEDET